VRWDLVDRQSRVADRAGDRVRGERSREVLRPARTRGARDDAERRVVHVEPAVPETTRSAALSTSVSLVQPTGAFVWLNTATVPEGIVIVSHEPDLRNWSALTDVL